MIGHHVDKFIRVCPECDRRFDLSIEADADEYTFGHDCEPQESEPDFEYLLRGDPNPDEMADRAADNYERNVLGRDFRVP